jgi:hypothetical protein
MEYFKGRIEMKYIASIFKCVLFVCVLGCQVHQTDIVRTVKLPDGTETTFTDKSIWCSYNPNSTRDQNINVNPRSTAAVLGVNDGGGDSLGFGSMNSSSKDFGVSANINSNANCGNAPMNYSPFTRTYGAPCYTEQQACASQKFAIR